MSHLRLQRVHPCLTVLVIVFQSNQSEQSDRRVSHRRKQEAELNDEELDKVVGGYNIGDTVICSYDRIEYCAGCGRLLINYSATITGVRGVLDGHTVYWATLNCCGRKSSIIDYEIHG